MGTIVGRWYVTLFGLTFLVLLWWVGYRAAGHLRGALMDGRALPASELATMATGWRC